MLTSEIALHLANAARQFPFLGISGPETLRELVRLELGHDGILDDYQPYGTPDGTHFTRAKGPATILHIISGNTPHAGLQSLIRGLLLKSRNLCKIPSAGLPEIAQFKGALPEELAVQIEIEQELPPEWLDRADALIVFGSDETIAHFQKIARPDQLFLPHGHKISFGIVFDDAQFESAALAARDFSLFNQQGCLSPHLVYVEHDASTYAERLAREMELFNHTSPRGPISPEESAQILAMRESYRFREAIKPGIRVWASESGTDWTVIFDPSPGFAVSCLNRVAFVKPLPTDLGESLKPIQAHLSTIGVWPASRAKTLSSLNAPRICPLGRMQSPPFSWHQDSHPTLAPLVTWQDLEL